MQSQKLVSFLFIYLIMVKMKSQKLVSFLCLFIKNLLQIYELIFI